MGEGLQVEGINVWRYLNLSDDGKFVRIYFGTKTICFEAKALI